MPYKTTLLGQVYTFTSIKSVLAKANEEKSGDTMLGIGAASLKERMAAKYILSNLTLEELRKNPVVPYEDDEVTRVIDHMVNETIYQEIKNLSVGRFRDMILSHQTTGEDIKRLSRALTGEMVAAVAKLMTNMDLVVGAKKINITSKCAYEIGLPGTISSRAQPNHPTDDIPGILASALECLSYATGDCVLGVNPVEDSSENTRRILEALHQLIVKLNIPTTNCVLSHITTQMEAVRRGAPCSMFFQSVAGTQTANTAFGIDASLLEEAHDLIKKRGISPGPNLMYFETGQGSEQSIDCDHGADEMTLEARSYGFAKQFNPYMVNNVSGFIGPETLYDGKQILRASLEDHFMGKLTGLPMGTAPCYTNHTNIDQNDQETATMLLAMAGANFFMSIPMGDDVMLSYQDTSCHDNAAIRETLGLTPAPEFFAWAKEQGLLDEKGRLTKYAGDPSIFNYKGFNYKGGQ